MNVHVFLHVSLTYEISSYFSMGVGHPVHQCISTMGQLYRDCMIFPTVQVQCN